MKLQKLLLTACEGPDVHNHFCFDTPALQRWLVSDRRHDQLAAVLEADESSIKKMIDARGTRRPVQGNLDPLALRVGGTALDRSIDLILKAFSQGPFIFNLGHGVLPDTPITHVDRLIARVRNAPAFG